VRSTSGVQTTEAGIILLIVAPSWRATIRCANFNRRCHRVRFHPTLYPHRPDVQNLRATPAMIATAVYQGGVAKDVATETHDLTVQAILDTMWLPECKD
jgi:hypothetical protein